MMSQQFWIKHSYHFVSMPCITPGGWTKASSADNDKHKVLHHTQLIMTSIKYCITLSCHLAFRLGQMPCGLQIGSAAIVSSDWVSCHLGSDWVSYHWVSYHCLFRLGQLPLSLQTGSAAILIQTGSATIVSLGWVSYHCLFRLGQLLSGSQTGSAAIWIQTGSLATVSSDWVSCCLVFRLGQLPCGLQI